MAVKIPRTLFFLAVLFALSSPASCGWERVFSSDAPLAVVSASTGAYEISYTVGEACAAPYELTGSGKALLSGYLSLIHPYALNQGFYGFDSASGVAMEGILWGAPPAESLKLLFANDISPALSSPGLVVTKMLDNTGTAVNEIYPVTAAYSGRRLLVEPSAAWSKGGLFSVYYSSSIMDTSGLPLSGAATVYFSVAMDHQVDNTAALPADTRVRVAVPANAYAEDFFLALSTDASRPEILTANAALPSLPGTPEFISLVSISPYSSSGVPAQPAAACVVSLPYADADGDGLLDGAATRIKASSLAVWRLDEDRGLWVKQTGASLDTVSRSLSLRVPRFSDYAVMTLPDADLSPVYAYPVPFRPNAGDPARYGTWVQGITFTQLPSAGKIRVYTVSGALVRELAVSPPSVRWDLKNSAGEVVASGTYLWEITSGSGRKTGKLVVIK